MVNTACAKGLFAKATRRRVAVPADLADRVERQLTRRCLDLVGLARRAGQAVAGYEKARQWLLAGKAGVVLAAADGAPASRGRIGALAPELPEIGLFSGEELGAVWGRERTVHVVLAPGGLAERLLAEAGRLAGFRAASGEGASLDQGSMARA